MGKFEMFLSYQVPITVLYIQELFNEDVGSQVKRNDIIVNSEIL